MLENNSLDKRPLMGITMGDACGIGPEVILKALAREESYRVCKPLVIGHPDILERDMAMAGVRLDVRVVERPEDGAFECGCVDVWSPLDVDMDQIAMGETCCEAGRAAAEWVICAVDLAMADRIDGIVTAPFEQGGDEFGGLSIRRTYGIVGREIGRRSRTSHAGI